MCGRRRTFRRRVQLLQLRLQLLQLLDARRGIGLSLLLQRFYLYQSLLGRPALLPLIFLCVLQSLQRIRVFGLRLG